MQLLQHVTERHLRTRHIPHTPTAGLRCSPCVCSLAGRERSVCATRRVRREPAAISHNESIVCQSRDEGGAYCWMQSQRDGMPNIDEDRSPEANSCCLLLFEL